MKTAEEFMKEMSEITFAIHHERNLKKYPNIYYGPIAPLPARKPLCGNSTAYPSGAKQIDHNGFETSKRW